MSYRLRILARQKLLWILMFHQSSWNGKTVPRAGSLEPEIQENQKFRAYFLHYFLITIPIFDFQFPTAKGRSKQLKHLLNVSRCTVLWF